MSPEEDAEHHKITTFAELVDLTTAENVGEMIENVTQTLLLVASLKAAGQPVALTGLTWVDDNRAGISAVRVQAPGAGG